MMKWVFYKPKFEYRANYDDRESAWSGHVYFAYDLVRNIKPEVIVELGTYKGTSFFSMLQAIKDSNLSSQAFAVDSWEGDIHTGTIEGGYDSEGIYSSVIALIRKYYPKQNARLLKMFFQEAIPDFENESINLLHIDGLHTYEAVKEDYETWKPKLADNSIILFHDSSVADFGVWKLWEEVKRDYEDFLTIEFKHSFGLGVAVKGKQYISAIKKATENLELFISHYEDQDYISKLESKHQISMLEASENWEKEKLTLLGKVRQLEQERNTLTERVYTLKNDLESINSMFNALISRRVVRIYRRLMKLFGKDIA